MHSHGIRAGVLGATGYVGSELVRLLGRHPRVRLGVATSEMEAGRPACGAGAARGLRLVRVADADLGSCDVVFSCLPHGEGAEWVRRGVEAGARVIDLSSDLRVRGGDTPAWAETAVYGLPELFRAELVSAALVANPGCYPTAVLVGLAPLLRRGLISGPVVVNAASGVTGAGRTPRRELLFGEVAEDFRAYGVGNVHRHVPEMRHHAARLSGREPAARLSGREPGGRSGREPGGAPAREPDLVFTPHVLPVRRGILATMYVPLSVPLAAGEARELWESDYAAEPFVAVWAEGVPSLASAVGTNRVVIGVAAVAASSSPALLVVSAIDNLLKGAAGQAVQNMNLALGWPETEGLWC